MSASCPNQVGSVHRIPKSNTSFADNAGVYCFGSGISSQVRGDAAEPEVPRPPPQICPNPEFLGKHWNVSNLSFMQGGIVSLPGTTSVRLACFLAGLAMKSHPPRSGCGQHSSGNVSEKNCTLSCRQHQSEGEHGALEAAPPKLANKSSGKATAIAVTWRNTLGGVIRRVSPLLRHFACLIWEPYEVLVRVMSPEKTHRLQKNVCIGTESLIHLY